MSMLYVVNCSPYIYNLKYLIEILKKNDSVIFISDGVISGMSELFFEHNLIEKKVFLYALEDDIRARGYFNNFSSNIRIIKYNDFINLTKQNNYFLW